MKDSAEDVVADLGLAGWLTELLVAGELADVLDRVVVKQLLQVAG